MDNIKRLVILIALVVTLPFIAACQSNDVDDKNNSGEDLEEYADVEEKPSTFKAIFSQPGTHVWYFIDSAEIGRKSKICGIFVLKDGKITVHEQYMYGSFTNENGKTVTLGMRFMKNTEMYRQI